VSKDGESRSLQVLRQAVKEERLAHGILLYSDSLKTLEREAMVLAGDLLKPISEERSASHPANHPDLFHLRPGKKMRLINVDSTRELIRQVYQTSNQGGNKVAIVHEADRFNLSGANAFLKSLEEPPAGTYILLLSTSPYDVLPTIRSRCFRFNVPATDSGVLDEAWIQWKTDYHAWLNGLSELRSGGKPAVSNAVFGLYGLLHRFEAIQKKLAAERISEESDKLTGHTEKDEKDALESRILRGTLLELLKETEQATRDFALDDKTVTTPARNQKLVQSVETLEELPGLLRLNLKDITALEYFLLKALRLWSQP
jgi:DNA polymerase-3 subunit delta'